MSKISVLKLRNNGGNAVLTIPVSILEETAWPIGSQIIMQFEKENNRVIIQPVTLETLKG